jgi:hypothetical protein
MKPKENQASAGLPVHQSQNEDQSRRKFLQTAIAVGAAVATAPITGTAQTRQSENSPELEDPLEKILNRYGSEFGNLNRIG